MGLVVRVTVLADSHGLKRKILVLCVVNHARISAKHPSLVSPPVLIDTHLFLQNQVAYPGQTARTRL